MAAQFRWETLPSVIFVEILSYLSLTDRLNATSACKRWRSCLFHPPLWRSIDFSVKYGGRKRAKFLGKMCARFVRQTTLAFTSTFYADVRESLKILKALAENPNLETLVLMPSSCQVQWPDREPTDFKQHYVATVKELICNSRRLKHLSLGCMGELTDKCDVVLELLRNFQASSLRSLHISSVKEDPDSYRLMSLPPSTFHSLHMLSTLGIDYDYLSNALLRGFVQQGKTNLHTLIIHVHGIDPEHKTITNDTWRQLVAANTNLEVSLNLIHSLDGATDMLDLLKPAMPLAHLRQFFSEGINVAAINFLSQHMVARLRSLVIVDGIIDGMNDGQPNIYAVEGEEDPFVMLAWRASNLEELTLIGYEVMEEDLVAIARLRGQSLRKLDIPECCLATVEGEEPQVQVVYGQVDQEFCQEISGNLGWQWHPITDNNLHPAILDPHADAETVYLSTLQQDQACH